MRRCMAVLALAALALTIPATAQAQGRRGRGQDLRKEGKLKVGDKAPNFKLALLNKNGKPGKKVELASFKGDRPVVLFFGSYT